MEILLATSSPTEGRTARNILVQAGYETVTECYDAETALAHLMEDHWDLLLTDKHLAHTNGRTLARRVRTRSRLSSLPILMIAGQYTHEDVLRATRDGVDGFLVFPCPASRLREKIEDLTRDAPGTDKAVIHRL